MKPIHLPLRVSFSAPILTAFLLATGTALAPSCALGAEPVRPSGTGSAMAGLDDLIIFDTRQRIRGTIVDADRPDRISIKTGRGTMTINRARVVGIEYGLASRVAYTAADDPVALMALALWCRANGHQLPAWEALSKAVLLPNCTLDVKGLFARLTDEVHGPAQAIPLYRLWREAGGADPTHLARLAQLENILGGAPLPTATTLPVAAPAEVSGPGTTTGIGGLSGLDANWRPDAVQWSNPAEVTLGKITDEKGTAIPAFVITASPGDKGKAAVRRGVRLDLSSESSGVPTFRVRNDSPQELTIALAIKTGPQWVYAESLPQRIAPGTISTLQFNVRSSDWKSIASSWRHNVAVPDLNDVREFQVLVVNGNSPATVTIGGIDIRPISAPQGK